ncbi:MAG: biotin/lipoyl-containing protein [Bacteroidota bacterium]|nr:biotin/lipoyl-containing protein [Bacteroidota bacterium]
MRTKESPKVSRFKSIVIEGTKYKTHLTTKFSNRKKWEKLNANQIFSFIPGTILKVKVKEGQKVKKGALGLIFEAMKMKNRVYIPKDGIVKKVNIKEGDFVPKGLLLIEMTDL